ncbi:MAG: F0F1 ATP synthase subunit A [Myxococcaceae bacterium]
MMASGNKSFGRAVLLGAVLAATTVFAQPPEQGTVEQHAPGEEVENQDVAGFIFHHVSDANSYEFELPLNAGHNPTVAFPTIMIPVRAGAQCGPLFTGFHWVEEGAGHGEEHRPGWSDGCLDLSPTKHVMMMFIGSALLLLTFLLGSHRNKSQLVPKGRLANFLEMLVLFVRNEIAIKNIGPEEGPRYTPYLLSAFFFILFLNLLGLVPWMATATGNLGVTAALALLTFVITQIASIRAAGVGGYLAHLTGGVPWPLWPIMIPVEILGLFTKPFALTIRLFANMLAGHVIIFFLLSLIFIMGSVAWGFVSVPFAFAIYLLEIFVAFVQAYIFTMLSALFIGMGVAMGHHGHDEHHEEAHGAGHAKDHGAGHAVGG